jgi:diguanylate cyclase (GGDEF)-like protein
MPGLKFGKIRDRVLALFIIVVLGLTVAVMAITGVLTRTLVTDLVVENAQALAHHQSQIIAMWQSERMADLQQLANSDLLETMDWDQIEPYLQRQIEEAPPYYLIFFVASPDGSYNTTLERNAGNISDREYFPKAMAGETVITGPLLSRSTNQRVIIVATPIWSEDHTTVQGLLGLSMDLEELLRVSRDLMVSQQHDSLYLVDENGYFIIHPDPDMIMNGRIQDVFPQWEQLPPQAGSFSGRDNGESYHAYYQKLPDPSGWTVAVRVPTSYFTSPVQRLILLLSLAGIVAFALVFWLGSWFASTISRPIVELNSIFRRGAEGDLTVRAEVRTNDEIGETGESFNRMMETIGTMTFYDPVTGLPNREHFMNSLESALTTDETIILALVSIRDMAEIKTFLHRGVLDRLLIHLASKLQEISAHDLIIGRLSEGEFGLIIPSNTISVLQVIDKLDQLLAQPLPYDESDMAVRLCGGISISVEQGLSADLFYQQAQAALYEAEHSGDEALKLYNPSVHHALVERMRFQSEIRTGLEQGQFTVYYQPVIDLKTQTVAGKEALIRWNHPTRGLLSPGQFLPAAEQGGLLEQIGEFMLDQVCAQHEQWLKAGFDPGWVSVNISANHFRSSHFPTQLRAILSNYDLPRDMLRLEITEEAMLMPTPDVLENFQALGEMGIYIAIDDFGTAYSSLHYLARYPMQGLKIDKEFIDDVDSSNRMAGLVRSIIGMGMNLAMEVVAEGVERPNQLELLQHMGCGKAQGFLFSQPVPWQDYRDVQRGLAGRLASLLPI